MTADAFLAWSAEQGEGRFELDAGEVAGMTAERVRHMRAKVRVRNRLEAALNGAGLPREAIADGIGVLADETTVYQPDAFVVFGEDVDGEATVLRSPVIIVEVTSPSTSRIGASGKRMAYGRMPSVEHHLIADLRRRLVVHHRRRAAGRFATAILAPDSEIDLTPPGIRLRADDFLD